MENPLLYLAAGVVGVLALLGCVSCTPAQRLAIAAFLAIPQFYIPNLPVSVADIWITFMAATAVADGRVRVVRKSVVLPIFGLGAVYLMAQAWSVDPFSESSSLIIARFALFGFLVCYALSVANRDPRAILVSVRLATPWVLFQSLLAISFRISPDLEFQFLNSTIGSILVGPSAAALWTGAANNVLDPEKSGGLFVNGNVASMFGGVAFFVFLMCRYLSGSKWNYVWASVALVGTIATGSKTGASLAVILPFLWFILPVFLKHKGRKWIVSVVLVATPVAFAVPEIIDRLVPQFANDSTYAYSSREALWQGAAVLFSNEPILGLGFGGWAASIGAVTGVYSLPPHNLIIAAWANGGILASAFVVLFMLVVVLSFIRKVWESRDSADARVAASGLCAVLWIFIHGMGDNTNIYGHSVTLVLAAIAVGALAVKPQALSVLQTPVGKLSARQVQASKRNGHAFRNLEGLAAREVSLDRPQLDR